MPLTAQTKTDINAAIAAGNPRRQAAERNARAILANPDAYPAQMVEDARIVVAPVVLKGVGA
jgi:hypothetical protein